MDDFREWLHDEIRGPGFWIAPCIYSCVVSLILAASSDYNGLLIYWCFAVVIFLVLFILGR